MIGVDTNVLVRLVVDDDIKQFEVAKRFFGERSPADPAVVSLVVVAEAVWVLRNPYAFDAERVTDFVAAMLDSDDFLVENRSAVESAVNLARASRADIADCLIAAVATNIGATSTVTFDRVAARRIPGMELLT